MIDWGDVPTWVTAGVALLALIAAFRAYRTQSEQLELQRQQSEDQTRIQEREQANLIDVVWQRVDPRGLLLLDEYSEVDNMLVVTNNSKRPIRLVRCKLVRSATDRRDPEPSRLADQSGELRPYPPGRETDTFIPVGGDMAPLIKAGAKSGFIWLFTDKPGFNWLQTWVRFTDDAGLDWEIDNNLHLVKVIKRDW